MKFDEVLYNYDLLDALDDMRFAECTPIQEQAIPVIEAGRDVLALAQTGTGKTAAYLLPIIDILADGGYPDDAINCVVMAPTRELAMQIDQQMQGFGYYLPQISSTSIYGGTDGKNFDMQKQALVKGADIVIATPGRLIAHMQMGYVDLSRVSFIVLDEADRMLDMGFIEDIKNIMSTMPRDKQTLMFSATISPKIKKLADQMLVDPVTIEIALSKPPEAIDQRAYNVSEAKKERLLKQIIREVGDELTIVFASSKQSVKTLSRAMRSWHVASAEMHSDLDQPTREQTMLDFRSGRVKVLIATDIVARGIDIDNIATIINYDVPRDAEDYVHRIGRTARAQSSGRAITFINERDREKFRRIEQLIDKKIPKKTFHDEGEPRDAASQPRGDEGSKPQGKNGDRRPKKAAKTGGDSLASPGKPSRSPGKPSKSAAPAQPQPSDAAAATQTSAQPAADAADKAAKKRRKWHHRRKAKPSEPNA